MNESVTPETLLGLDDASYQHFVQRLLHRHAPAAWDVLVSPGLITRTRRTLNSVIRSTEQQLAERRVVLKRLLKTADDRAAVQARNTYNTEAAQPLELLRLARKRLVHIKDTQRHYQRTQTRAPVQPPQPPKRFPPPPEVRLGPHIPLRDTDQDVRNLQGYIERLREHTDRIERDMSAARNAARQLASAIRDHQHRRASATPISPHDAQLWGHLHTVQLPFDGDHVPVAELFTRGVWDRGHVPGPSSIATPEGDADG